MQVFDLGSTGHTQTGGLITAREAGLVACRGCGQVHGLGTPRCKRCDGRLASRAPGSIQKVWAYLIAGMIAFIPANVYPMLLTKTLVEHSESTIIGGVGELISHHNYGIAAIVFIASILIPVGKFLAIIYLALSVRRLAPWRRFTGASRVAHSS